VTRSRAERYGRANVVTHMVGELGHEKMPPLCATLVFTAKWSRSHGIDGIGMAGAGHRDW
jgi:hypothetical protein